ncbi:hypothetical protein SNEBB_010665 [Seison nebaliae]|nr:hypothetical protein SNEBB_010665 [Seison nebaliae]
MPRINHLKNAKGTGPHAWWRYGYLRQLYRRREQAGPEIELLRSQQTNWNTVAELSALNERFGFNKRIINEKFIHQSLSKKKEEIQLKKIESFLNEMCKEVFPKLPNNRRDRLVDYLCKNETLKQIGTDYHLHSLLPKGEDVSLIMMSLLEILSKEYDDESLKRFLVNFQLKRLMDEDIIDIVIDSIDDGKSIMKDLYGNELERRLIHRCINGIYSSFIIGQYVNRKLVGEGCGASLMEAEENSLIDGVIRHFELDLSNNFRLHRLLMRNLNK